MGIRRGRRCAGAPERQAPVSFDAVPAELGGFELMARHGLHRIAENRLYIPDRYGHILI